MTSFLINYRPKEDTCNEEEKLKVIPRPHGLCKPADNLPTDRELSYRQSHCEKGVCKV